MSTVLVALLIMYIGCGLNGELFPYLLQFVYNYCNGCLLNDVIVTVSLMVIALSRMEEQQLCDHRH